MNRAVVVFLHGGYWSVYLLMFLLVISTFARMQPGRAEFSVSSFLPLVVLAVMPNLISFYSFYFWLFPNFLSRGKTFTLGIAGIIVSICSALAGALLSSVFFGFGQVIFAEVNEFMRLASSLFVIAAIHGTVALVLRGFIAWFEEIKTKEEFARRNFEVEMALVKSQINPHFLFNTINNIDVLITKNPKQASIYLNKLSDLLRYAVYETKSEKILLTAELGHVERYIELQKIRTRNPNYVQLQIDGNANGHTVAPMIFFPFIENAFKHTENKKNGSTIRIRVSVEKEMLIFECENSYHPIADRKPQDFGGLGNDLIKKRLELIYPNKHRLEINDDSGNYRVKLMLY